MTIKVPNETKEVWAILQGIANKYGRYVKSLSRNIQGTWDVEVGEAIYWKEQEKMEQEMREAIQAINDVFVSS